MARRDRGGDPGIAALRHRRQPRLRPKPRKILRGTPYALLAATILWLLLALDLSLPPDVDTWTPGPLTGEVVNDLESGGSPQALLAGTNTGLYVLSPGGAEPGAERVGGVPGPVHELMGVSGEVLAATEEGVYALAPGEGARPEGPEGVPAYGISRSEGVLYAATEKGLFRHLAGWERVWPVGEDGSNGRVNAVLAVEDAVLFGTEDGLFGLEGAEARELSSGSVVHLSQDGAGRVWAGFRGEPLLLVSGDGGRTWEESRGGIGLDAVNALLAQPGEGPGDDGTLYIGGSGLADGEGNAGVMTSGDGGKSWQTRQDRLSNTPVSSLSAREEPLHLGISLPPLVNERSVRLPGSGARIYAGTNGDGAYTYRPAGPVLSSLAALAPAARLAEPVVLGALLLAVVWKLYRTKRYPKGRSSGGPQPQG